MFKCAREIVAHILTIPIRGGFLYQKMHVSIVGRGHRTPETGLLGIPGFLVEKEESLIQQVFCKGHGLHPSRIKEMGIIGREIKIGLKSPPIVGLKSIEKRGRHSTGHIRESRCMDGIGSEQDSEEDRGLTVRVRSNREADVAYFSRIEHPCRFNYGLIELRLMYDSWNVHEYIISLLFLVRPK